jgi:hypothetical protein
MEKGTLIQHLEVIVICEESSTNVDGNMVILDVYLMMKGENKKVKKFPANVSKSKESANIPKNIITKNRSVLGTLITQKIN